MNHGSWRRLGFAAAWGLLGTFICASGCASKAECETSRCAAGNACIDDGTGSGSTCHKVCTGQADCPYGYYCNDGQLGSEGQDWCVPNTNYPPQASGQWMTPCPTSGGEKNAACDWNDFFACYGTGPTDAASFCTEFGCGEDSDCKGGWWCSTQNVGPNVTTANATFGKTRTLCLPRWYCAPCQTDHDCSAAEDGTLQHCVPDAKGNNYCTPECTGNSDCAPDATCVRQWPVCTPNAPAAQACASDDDCPSTSVAYQHCNGGKCTPECGSGAPCGAGQTCGFLDVCVPRAGECVGSGGFCSPCRSDVDCTDGFCLSAEPFSTERFCSAKATVASCDTSAADPPGCPAPTAADNWKEVVCTETPADQCVALVTLGANTAEAQDVPGCWTINR